MCKVDIIHQYTDLDSASLQCKRPNPDQYWFPHLRNKQDPDKP